MILNTFKNIAILTSFCIITCCHRITQIENSYSFSPNLDTFTFWSINTRELKCKGIPDSVFQMVNLKTLYIQGEDCDIKYDRYGNDLHPECCFLRKISSKIKYLKKLEKLYLPLNGLDSLPSEIAECQSLKIIDLTDGSAMNIDILTKLKNLEVLYVFGCYMNKLPENISDLKNLKELGLTGNKIDKDELERIKRALPNCEIIFEN